MKLKNLSSVIGFLLSSGVSFAQVPNARKPPEFSVHPNAQIPVDAVKLVNHFDYDVVILLGKKVVFMKPKEILLKSGESKTISGLKPNMQTSIAIERRDIKTRKKNWIVIASTFLQGGHDLKILADPNFKKF